MTASGAGAARMMTMTGTPRVLRPTHPARRVFPDGSTGAGVIALVSLLALVEATLLRASRRAHP